jgi:coenzyme F420-0:L-glutamate ligase/coenzyme F420-1:gamma-L-glutamate ligase
MELKLSTLDHFPLVKPGDDLAEIIAERVVAQGISPQKGDIFIIAQKVVSKAEGRLRNLTDIVPSKKALEIAEVTQKDSRFVEAVLSESKSVLRTRFNTLIVEHNLGFICANAELII